MHKRAFACVLGVVASTLTLTSPASAAPAVPSAGQRVTLITGDVVTAAGGQIGIEPAKRDRPVAFERRSKNGDEYVIPADAATLVAAGKLDQQLFNVTGLIRQRYDDAHTDSVPLLIEGAARTDRRFGELNMASVSARKGSWREVVGSGEKIWLNAKLSASLDVSVPQTGAPAAWQAGLTGQGVTVAVLDSGIDATHPDLAGKVALSKDFTGTGSTKAGQVSQTSSRGPRVGDAAMKPEIAAPGTDITAARAKDSPGEGGHVTKSGTSMAAPHVAGAAAILAGQHPDWTGEAIKSALIATASPVAAHPYEAGNGRVDIARATTSPVLVSPSSVSANLKWPETKPRKNTVTYRNTGPTPLTLSLAVDLKDAGGQAAPASLAKLSASSLTIAPGKTASATLTSTPRSRPGQYGGSLKATTVDGQSIRTPISVQDEAEAYDLTVSLLDRDGKAVTDASLIAVDQLTADRITVPAGKPVRLPGGKYTIMAAFAGPTGYIARLAHPEVDLRRTTSITLDSRQAHRVSVRTDQPSISSGAWSTTMWMKVAGGEDRIGVTTFGDPLSSEVYAYSPPNVSSPLFTYYDAFRLMAADGKQYELAFPTKGRVAVNVAYSVRTADLAAVTERFYGQHPDAPPIAGTGNIDFDVPVGLPFYAPVPPGSQRVVYFTPGKWRLAVITARDSARAGEMALAAGGTYQVEWNRAVLSPGFAGRTSSELGADHPWAFRRSTLMSVEVPFYTDAAGHTVVPDTETGTATGTTSLYTGDRLIGTQHSPGRGVFWVGQGDSEFRLVVEADRDQRWWPLSTKVTSEWAFSARFRQGPFDTPLPLLAVRAGPPVDLGNKSPSGPVEIPLSVTRQDGPATVTDLTLEYSVDDGTTWQQATVADGKAAVTNPADGFVSLRTKATDTDGNTVTTTVIRAYQTV